MDEVWLVEHHDYDTHNVLGAFANEDLARGYAATNPYNLPGGADEYDVSVITVHARPADPVTRHDVSGVVLLPGQPDEMLPSPAVYHQFKRESDDLAVDERHHETDTVMFEIVGVGEVQLAWWRGERLRDASPVHVAVCGSDGRATRERFDQAVDEIRRGRRP